MNSKTGAQSLRTRINNVTFGVLQDSVLDDDSTGTNDLLRGFAAAIATEVSQQLTARSSDTLSAAQRYAWAYDVGEVSFDQPSDEVAAQLQKYPMRALICVLRLCDALEPSGAELALAGYREAIESEPDLNPADLVPDNLQEPTPMTPHEIGQAFRDFLESQFFNGPWPQPAVAKVKVPEELSELTVYGHTDREPTDPPLCIVNREAEGWVFRGYVDTYYEGNWHPFDHLCTDGEEALAAVPWHEAREVQTKGGSPEFIRSLLLDLAAEGTHKLNRLPTFTVDGQPLVNAAFRREFQNVVPPIVVHRHFADGRREEHELRGEDALTQLVTQGLHILRRGESTEYTCMMAPETLMDALVVDTSGGDEQPDDWADTDQPGEWQAEVDEMRSALAESPLLVRWARVNEYLLAAFHEDKHEPGLAMFDTYEMEILPNGPELARYSWFSESGGAPVSWDGGSCVADLGRGWLMIRRWGDLESMLEISTGSSDLAEAATIFYLIQLEEAYLPAAIELEALDPNNSLTADERAEWAELLSEVTMGLDLDCSTAVTELLRQMLSEVSDYQQTKAALDAPTEPLGQRLKSALDDFARDGVLGGLLANAWTRLDPPSS